MMLRTCKTLRTIVADTMLFALSLSASVPAKARDLAGTLEVGDTAADFELSTLDEQKVKLSKLVEDGPVVLVVLRGYPGYQCPVCNAQVGQFLSRADQFRQAGARVVLVYPGPAADLQNHAADFVRGKTLPDNFYLLLDPDYAFTNAYGLRWNAPKETAYPSTFVIDRKRTIQFAKISTSHGGRASAVEILKSLKPL